MATVKQEPYLPTEATENTRESRASSVATMTEIPIRASSVVPRSAPHTSADAHINTTVDGDIEMAGSNIAEHPLDAMEALGQRSRAVIQVIRKLAALNINTTLKSLPKIVVIGDQSAGKSSVIEALCDIELPRSEGTCTRCPFQLTTTSTVTGSSLWTCSISLLTQFVYLPKQTARAARNEKYARWEEQAETTTSPFATLYEKEDLGIALRRAQLAILNPQHDYRDYANMSVEEVDSGKKNQVAFSPNVVCLEIAGANLPELSFYDLPGAINSTSNEEDGYLVEFVETLLKNYMGDDKAIILLACAANHDIETATVIRFLRSCKTTNGKKAGERVMGILTKPDLVGDNPGKIAIISSVLSGQLYPMGHGWFATKQSSERELQQGVTRQRARELEADFFASGPWAEELACHRGRFGTTRLQDTLSLLLTKHIQSELPGILERVEYRLNQVDQALATYPAQEAAPAIAIIQEIDVLKTAILSQLNADGISDFRAASRQACRDLQMAFVASQPVVDLSTPGYVKMSISLDSTDEETPTKKIRPSDTVRTLSATPRRTPAPAPGSSGRLSTTDRRRKVVVNNSQVAVAAARTEFNLEDVKRSFDSAPGADLPGGPSNIITKKLILDTLCGWKTVIDKVLKTIKEAFLQMLSDTIDSALASRHATELFKQVGRILNTLFRELITEETAVIDRILAREKYRPITYATEAMKQKKHHFKTQLQARRLKHRTTEYFEDLESRGYRCPTEADIEKKSKDPAWVQATLGTDQYSREVEELAWPLAYYDVVSVQLCDTVAREVEFGLLFAYEQRVHRKLLEELRTGDAAYCAELLAEDPQRERERISLLGEKDKLTQARAELSALSGVHA